MICSSGASLTLLNRPFIVSNFWYLFMNLSFDLLFCSRKKSTFFEYDFKEWIDISRIDGMIVPNPREDNDPIFLQ